MQKKSENISCKLLVHFASFWPRNFKTRFSPKKTLWATLRLYCTVTVTLLSLHAKNQKNSTS